MIDDPIVEEIRRFREAHAARFNYDVDAMFADLMERQKGKALVTNAREYAARQEEAKLAAVAGNQTNP